MDLEHRSMTLMGAAMGAGTAAGVYLAVGIMLNLANSNSEIPQIAFKHFLGAASLALITFRLSHHRQDELIPGNDRNNAYLGLLIGLIAGFALPYALYKGANELLPPSSP